MEKKEVKDKVLEAIWLLDQRGKGNKGKARNLLYKVFINL
jgi:hypothetical protein